MILNKVKSKYYSAALKVVIFILLVYALYKQLISRNQIHEIYNWFNSSSQTHLFYYFLVFILMFINWGFETLKWKKILHVVYPITYIKAYKAVWTGVTFGLFTPNRIGEYGGRILYLPKKFRIQAIVVTLIGSFSQIVVTCVFGVASSLIYIFQFYSYTTFIDQTLCIVGIFLVIGICALYYNFSYVIFRFKNYKLFKRIQFYIEIIQQYHVKQYSEYLLYSFLRFLVYTAQYLIFLKIFGVHLHLSDGIIAVGTIFFIQTIVPSFAIAELLTRGNIAIFVLSNYGDYAFAAVASSTCLWLLNLIIPSILGYLFIIKLNFFKSKN